MRTVLAALVIAALGGVAHGQSGDAPTDEEKAKVLFDEGTRHYNLAEYAEAIERYKEAYRLLPDPLFLFNIGQAYRQDNDCAHARTFYKSYLRNAPDAYNREKVEQRIVEMEACIRAAGSVPEVDPPDPLETKVEPVVEPPVEPPVEPVHTRAHDSETPPSGQPLAPRFEPPTERDWTAGRPQRLIGIGTAGLGVVLVGSAVMFSFIADEATTRYEQECAEQCDGVTARSLDDEARTATSIATGLYIAGGVAVAAGAALYAWGWHAAREAPVIGIAPSSSGATIVGAWTW
jgi:tetratricopeptide (TPR) repeat protein